MPEISGVLICLYKNTFMSGEQPLSRFNESVTLEQLREKIQEFAQERDWDQVVTVIFLNL